MKDETKSDILSIIILVATLAAVFIGVYANKTYQCNSYGEVTGRDVKYNISGCYVKNGNKWLPRDEYKFMSLEKAVKKS